MADDSDRKGTIRKPKKRDVSNNTGDGIITSEAESGSPFDDSDHIEHSSHDNNDTDTELDTDGEYLLEQLELIKSKSANNIRNRQKAHDEYKGRRQRERNIRRNRIGRRCGGGEVGSGTDGTGIRSSDTSPDDSSDEETDTSDDEDDSDDVVITKSKINKSRSNPYGSGSSKRKASMSVQTSSGIDSSCYTTIQPSVNDRKKKDMRRGGGRSARVVSASESSDGKSKVKPKRNTHLTGIRHRRHKRRMKKRRPSRHTKVGRAEERIFNGTTAGEVFIAKVAIKKCQDVLCKCPHDTASIIAGRTYNLEFNPTTRKQWLLDKILSMETDWKHLIIEGKRHAELVLQRTMALR